MNSPVFISYSSKDRDPVMEVVEALRISGISVWVDEGGIHAADLWSEQIVEAIKHCQVMIVIVSENSINSHNVVKEVMLASENKKSLLPLYLEKVDIPSNLEYQLAGIQHLEYFGKNKDEVLVELITGLDKRGINSQSNYFGDDIKFVKNNTHARNKKLNKKSYSNGKIIFISVFLAFLLTAGFLLQQLSQNSRISDSGSMHKNKLSRIHFQIPIPNEYPLANPTDMPFGVAMNLITVSPSGDKLAYVCTYQNSTFLCLRNFNEKDVQLLSGTRGALLPFFRPDGNKVGFITEKKLKTLDLNSGLIKEVCDVKNAYYGACWGSDGFIYFGNSEGNDFVYVSEDGGLLTHVSEKIKVCFNPRIAMEDRGLIFSSAGLETFRGPLSVYFMPFDNKNNVKMISSGQHPAWVGSNVLVTEKNGQLFSTMIDTKTIKPISQSKLFMQSKVLSRDITHSQHSFSQNNIVAFIEGESSREYTLTSYDPISNNFAAISDRVQEYGQFSVSPDGDQIAIEVLNSQISDIQILDLNRGRFSSFTSEKSNYTPFWSKDSSKLFYASYRNDPKVSELYSYDFKNRSETHHPLEGEPMRWFDISDVSKDGKTLICFGVSDKGLCDLYQVDIEKMTKTKLTSSNYTEWGGVLSNDEKLIVYTSEKDMEGSYAIYLNRFPEMDNPIRISAGGGEEPKWLPDGSGVYYRNGSQWLTVKIDFKQKVQIGEPEPFFEGDYANVWGPSHDVFPDGRILVLKGKEWPHPSTIDVIINPVGLP